MYMLKVSFLERWISVGHCKHFSLRVQVLGFSRKVWRVIIALVLVVVIRATTKPRASGLGGYLDRDRGDYWFGRETGERRCGA